MVCIEQQQQPHENIDWKKNYRHKVTDTPAVNNTSHCPFNKDYSSFILIPLLLFFATVFTFMEQGSETKGVDEMENKVCTWLIIFVILKKKTRYINKRQGSLKKKQISGNHFKSNSNY